MLKSFLRTPLVREFYLERDLSNVSRKSGISGLAELSMPEENSHPAYAVTKYAIREKGIDQDFQVIFCTPLNKLESIGNECGGIIPVLKISNDNMQTGKVGFYEQ